jgi:hypothetical protein
MNEMHLEGSPRVEGTSRWGEGASIEEGFYQERKEFIGGEKGVSPSLTWKSFGGNGRQGAGTKKEDGVRGSGLGAEL